jgi:two-component system sensor histidine kinase DesK
LADALERAEEALGAAGIDYELERAAVALPAEVEAVLAWAVREGTTNVVRHSGARHCSIRVRNEGASAAVEVEDNGHRAPAAAIGNGLSGLAERAAGVRGTLEAGARPDGGFRLRLTVPLVRS